jgi:plasmid maintenance system antidote protein VapI
VSVSALARRLGVARGTVRKLVSGEMAEKVPARDAKNAGVARVESTT